MLRKHILTAILCIVVASPLYARHVVENDTIITASGHMIIRPARQVIAANISSPAQSRPVVAAANSILPEKRQPLPAKNAEPKKEAPKEVAVTKKETTGKEPAKRQIASNDDKSNGYNHVPLAGEKAYFGEKNEYVNDFVRKYLELHNKTLGNVQDKSEQPFSVIDNVLEKKNLPKELKYLAVIESALNHNAVSSAGAVGPWQLMQSTARMMGLSVSRHHDDRTDLYKSTSAATKYLELLYSQLNDWLLVIAAYNSGPVPVQRAIERTGSHNFWDIKQYLPRETQGHVLAFIATASIFENLSQFISLGSIPADFKFGKEEEALPVAVKAEAADKVADKPIVVAGPPTVAVKKQQFTDEELKNMAIVRITKPLQLDWTAQELGIDKKILYKWNPDYEMFIYDTYPTPYYNLRLPKDKLDLFLQKKESLAKKSAELFSAAK